MDKKGNIKKHSQEKLLVYEKYLIEYLSVLTNQSYYKDILIWDIFAGKGKDEKGSEGSALIAAKVIKDFKEKKNKDLRLFLNELDKEKFEELKNNLKDYKDFIEFYNHKAENFLKAVLNFSEKSNDKILNFFFIDPHGYTQYSTETLKKLLSLKNSEYLIFIPTNHIYRFAKALKENNPAAKFVYNLGIENKDFKNPKDFKQELENKFKEIGNTDFVYSYKIENKEASSSFYHLFFITKHIKGAEKFLEAKNKVKKSLPQQLTLFDNLNKENEIKTYLKNWKSNVEIYEWTIKNSLLPQEINPILKKLEDENQLDIQAYQKRKKGSFYLKDKTEKIKIKLK